MYADTCRNMHEKVRIRADIGQDMVGKGRILKVHTGFLRITHEPPALVATLRTLRSREYHRPPLPQNPKTLFVKRVSVINY